MRTRVSTPASSSSRLMLLAGAIIPTVSPRCSAGGLVRDEGRMSNILSGEFPAQECVFRDIRGGIDEIVKVIQEGKIRPGPQSGRGRTGRRFRPIARFACHLAPELLQAKPHAW